MKKLEMAAEDMMEVAEETAGLDKRFIFADIQIENHYYALCVTESR